MKKKILIIINSELFVRNYLKTNSFKYLEKNFRTYFLANKEIKEKSVFKKKKFLGFFNYQESDKIFISRIMNISMWRHRNRSKSFLYRIKWFSQIDLYELKNNFSFSLLKKKLKKILQVLKLNLYIRLIGNKIIYPFFEKFYIERINVLQSLEKKINKLKPDLIIFPTQSQTKADYDIVKICKKINIKTFFLIDNWDNLSDKSIIYFKPDFLGVWGPQTKKHAIKIQNINSNKIFNLGTPRFEHYFDARKKKIHDIFKFKYILFLGTALEFDEFRILKKINEILKKNDMLKGIKLVYRPHPWRMSKKSFNFKKYSNIILDPQVSKNYYKKQINLSFQPDLNYYPKLIKNCEFVVGGLTSMIIESLIMYKKYLITSIPERQFNNQYNSLNFHTHFKELRYVTNIHFCKSMDSFEKTFFSMWKNRSVRDIKKTDLERSYFLHYGNKKYSKRIFEITNKILYK